MQETFKILKAKKLFRGCLETVPGLDYALTKIKFSDIQSAAMRSQSVCVTSGVMVVAGKSEKVTSIDIY